MIERLSITKNFDWYSDVLAAEGKGYVFATKFQFWINKDYLCTSMFLLLKIRLWKMPKRTGEKPLKEQIIIYNIFEIVKLISLPLRLPILFRNCSHHLRIKMIVCALLSSKSSDHRHDRPQFNLFKYPDDDLYFRLTRDRNRTPSIR